jgi:hypothetical protein
VPTGLARKILLALALLNACTSATARARPDHSTGYEATQRDGAPPTAADPVYYSQGCGGTKASSQKMTAKPWGVRKLAGPVATARAQPSGPRLPFAIGGFEVLR